MTSGGLELGCKSMSAKGVVTLGKSLTGKRIAEVRSSVWKDCIGPAGLAMTVEQQGVWRIDAVGEPGAVVTGQVSGAKGTIVDTNTGGQQCSVTVSGTLGGTIDTTRQTLDTTGGPLPGAAPLKLSNVKGCFGLVSNGETAKLYGIVKLSNDVGKLTVKSK